MNDARRPPLMREMELRLGEPMEILLPRLFNQYQNARQVRRYLNNISHNTLKNWVGVIGYKMDTTTRIVKKETA